MEIPCPERFDYDAEKWPAWKARFTRFRSATDLCAKSDARQISTLIYCMGDKAEDIFKSLQLSTEDADKYDKVLDAFDRYFVIRKNIVFERAQFNLRRQLPGETAATFITVLNKLADTCEFGALRDELIRDRLVISICDAKLSEKLQMDDKLTLEKAITTIRQAESVHQQQEVLRGATADSKDVMQMRSDPYKRQQYLPQDNLRQQHNKQERHDSQQHTSCKWCGRQPAHQRTSCPAKDVTCNNCLKKGHFAKVCQSSAAAGNIKSIFAQPASDAIFEDDTYDALFLNTLSDSSATDVWRADIIVDGKASISFKLDTGADATVIPWSTYQKHLTQPLQPSDKRLFGPNRAPLDIAGMFRATLIWRSASSTQSIYVMRDVQQALLGRPAIDALSILRTVDAISTLDDVKGMFPELFTGLGCMSGSPYKIRLSDSAKPHAIYTPRRVPLALLPQLKAELDKLLRLDVIRKVDEPTAWCAGIVVVPKRSGDIRLCVDLSRLNEAMLREQHTLPDIGQMLASLTGATIFSKLDCNSGFHQVPLDTESALLTTFTTPFGRYCYTRLPFGISSASEHFQKRMSHILEGLEGVICLIDDILVHGKDKQEHDTRLMLTLQRIKAHGVTLNSKCEFFKSEIKSVGHILSSSGIRPDPDKISAITNMPAQLLMSRQLRSTLPTTTSILHPQPPDYQALRTADDNIKQHQKVNYDRFHAARTMPSWSMGDNVWIADLHLNATVIKLLPHRSYLLRTSRGTTVRRNGRLLRVPLPPSDRDFLASPSPGIPCHVRDAATIAAPTAPSAPPQQQQRVLHPPTITRPVRTVKPPDRLNL
jgi:uncharacterized protein (DUF427 family)